MKSMNCLRLRLAAVAACAFFMLSLTIHSAVAQSTPYTWKSVIAGGGGFVPGIVYHPAAPGLAYARTDIGGAYRWDNAAGVWVPLNDMMNRSNSDYMGILSIGLDRNDTNRIYMECGKYTQSWAGTGAVLASTDKGTTWTTNVLTVKIGGNEDGRGTGERLQVDPNLGSVLFMGTTVNGLWQSTNYGSTWASVSSFTPTNVTFVLFDPSSGTPGNATQRIFVGTVNTAGQSLYRTENGGTTWSVVAGQPNGVMAIRSAITDTLLYITAANAQGPNGAGNGSVWKYGIPSGTWTNISPANGSYGFSGIALYPPNPRIMIVCTLDKWSPMDEVYLSTNGGANWATRLTSGTLDHSYAPYTAGNINPHWLGTLAMDPFDSSKAMFGTGYGIWATNNLMATPPVWYFKDQKLEETVPLQIISPPFDNLLSVMSDYDGFRHTTLDVSPPNRYYPYKWSTHSIAYAGKAPSRIVKAYDQAPYGSYSTDGGATWRDFTSAPSGTTGGGSYAIAISADGNTIVWAPPGGAMSYSTNNGKTWTAANSGAPLVPPVADKVNPNMFYAYDGSIARMWRSTDGGRTWGWAAGGLPSVPSYLAADGNVTAVPNRDGDIWICFGSGGLYHSTNWGSNVTKLSTVTEAFRFGLGRAATAGGYPAFYLFGTVGGVTGFFRSDDVGATWTRINDNAHQYGWVHQITGDMRVYGRCYISAEGRGMAYGEPQDTTNRSNVITTFSLRTSFADSLRHPFQAVPVSWSRAADPPGNTLTYVLHFFGPGVDTIFTSTDTAATISAGAIRTLSPYVLTGWVTNGVDTTCSTNSIVLSSAGLVTGVEMKGDGVPDHFELNQNFPNPFNPRTTISFSLPVSSTVTLAVYDITGREITALLRNVREVAGTYRVFFDAGSLASGVYFYRLRTDKFEMTRRMTLIK